MSDSFIDIPSTSTPTEFATSSHALRELVKSTLIEIVADALGTGPLSPKRDDPPVINSVSVTLYTTSDDKDKEEDVDVSIVHQNGTIHATQIFGHDQKFDNDSNTGPLKMNLTTPVLKTDGGRLHVRVFKHPFGSPTGNGWHMQIEVTASCSDGTGGVLLSKTEETRMGDGNPFDRIWNFQSIG